MPDFDLCRMELSELVLFGAVFAIVSIAVGFAFAAVLRRLEDASRPTRFMIGAIGPLIVAFFALWNLVRMFSASECGFTPDSVVLGLFAMVLPFLAPAVALWRSS